MDTPKAPPQENVPQPASGGMQSGGAQQQVLGLLAQLETVLDEVMIKKAPFQIPMDGKEFIASAAPYLVILAIVLFALSIPAFLGLGALLGAAGRVGVGWASIVSLLAGVVALALEAMALSGLFKRTIASWRLVFYASVVSVAGSLLSLHIVGAVVGAVIGWYLLFQVKEMYKN